MTFYEMGLSLISSLFPSVTEGMIMLTVPAYSRLWRSWLKSWSLWHSRDRSYLAGIEHQLDQLRHQGIGHDQSL